MSGRKKNRFCSISLFCNVLILGTILLLGMAALFRLQTVVENSRSYHIIPTVSVSPEVSPQTHPACVESTPETLLHSTAQASGSAETGSVNFLLVGQDSREPGARARSDAMILCSLDPGSRTVTLISFLRDLYVQIPGYSGNRLNAAYAWGGMPLLKQTLSQNFGVQVDGCIEVDFQQFVRLVDLLGGITLTLRRDEAQQLNQLPGASLEEGVQHLDGQQALAYVRIRNLDPDGDFSRTLRQRKLLTALLEQLRQCSLREILSLLSTLSGLVSTDMSTMQIASHAAVFLPFLSGASTEHLCIPADGTYTPETIDGMSVLVADPHKTKEVLRAALGEE